MLTVLTGENSFEVTRALDALVASYDGEVVRADGVELELSHLVDYLSALSLFASARMVIIKELSANKPLWDALPTLLERLNDDVHLVLIEPKPDKRTKTYKDLKKIASIKEFAPWGDREAYAAEKWVVDEAGRQGFQLDGKSAQVLVARIGTDQWRLYHALEKLAVLDDVTPALIERVIESQPTENVFNLFEAALRGDTKKVSAMIKTLEYTQDPFMTFGLLSGQVFQLAALTASDKPSADVAKDIGAHPYALGKLAPYAKQFGRGGVRRIVTIFADTDTAMKSTAADTWLLIEKALIKTASV